MRVRVSTPTQIRHEGRTYSAGDEIDVPVEAARKWVAAGWVVALASEAASLAGLAANEPGPDLKLHRDDDRGTGP